MTQQSFKPCPFCGKSMKSYLNMCDDCLQARFTAAPRPAQQTAQSTTSQPPIQQPVNQTAVTQPKRFNPYWLVALFAACFLMAICWITFHPTSSTSASGTYRFVQISRLDCSVPYGHSWPTQFYEYYRVYMNFTDGHNETEDAIFDNETSTFFLMVAADNSDFPRHIKARNPQEGVEAYMNGTTQHAPSSNHVGETVEQEFNIKHPEFAPYPPQPSQPTTFTKMPDPPAREIR